MTIAGLVHALHDGYTDAVYVFLPVWQVEFGLSYGFLGLLKGIYSATMATLQMPASLAGERCGVRLALPLGTALAAMGYITAGYTSGMLGLCAALVLSGVGSSVQHPIGSTAVSRAFAGNARQALGVYNLSGDLGKVALPAAASFLMMFVSWRSAAWSIAGIGCAVVAAILIFMPGTTKHSSTGRAETAPHERTSVRRGFIYLFSIGIFDAAVRVGLLTFLPFVLKTKGATLPTIGIVFAMIFSGGAIGKFACGWVGARIGVLRTVILTEAGTAVTILLVLALPLTFGLCVLPLLGSLLNGTSSVLYGTVPEISPQGRTAHFFALFYTGISGTGALAPALYGALGDAVGTSWSVAATAITALATIPFAFALDRHLSDRRQSL